MVFLFTVTEVLFNITSIEYVVYEYSCLSLAVGTLSFKNCVLKHAKSKA